MQQGIGALAYNIAETATGRIVSIPQPPLILWQFTDTHLAADPAAALMGVNVFDSLRRVVAMADRHAPRPDLILVTGDLVHDDSAAGYQLLADTFAPLNAPVYCLPGNHDDRALMRSALNGSARYADIWRGGHWQVILLDSTCAGEAAGFLSQAEFARLRACLQSHPDHHTLVCLHHPPVQIGSAWMDAMGLHNGDALLALLASYPQVRGIAWGHNHQAFDGEWRGIRLFGTPSTCVQFAPGATQCAVDPRPPGYRWLALHADGRIESAVRRAE